MALAVQQALQDGGGGVPALDLNQGRQAESKSPKMCCKSFGHCLISLYAKAAMGFKATSGPNTSSASANNNVKSDHAAAPKLDTMNMTGTIPSISAMIPQTFRSEIRGESVQISRSAQCSGTSKARGEAARRRAARICNFFTMICNTLETTLN